MTTAFITHPAFLKHDMGSHHPEQPARLMAIEDQLIASGIASLLTRIDAPQGKLADIERVHPMDYIVEIRNAAPQTGIVHIDPDTAMCAGTWEALLRGTGAAVLATDLVMAGEVDNAFCSVRPPGHHAMRARAMGFCFFNNVAVAAKHALEHHGLERVAIVDFDVHHGNGTEDIFAGDERVLMTGIFQHPFYPYSGIEGHSGRMVNIPLAAYSGGKEFRAAVEKHWLPTLERFKPEMLFISAGFDAHRDDDMAMLKLVEADYAWVTQQLKAVADKYAQGRIVSLLEGGYELHALGRSVATHLKALAEI